MTIPFYKSLDNTSGCYRSYNNGLFFDSKRISENISHEMYEIDPWAAGHDADKLFWTFHYWFNPSDEFFEWYDKKELVDILKRNIDYIKSHKYTDFEEYLIYKVYEYFLQVYQSKHTKIRPNNYDVVDLFETTGYHPNFSYTHDPNSKDLFFRKEKFIYTADEASILKSILVQSCQIDSFEFAPSIYNRKNNKTILTSKPDPYETFYNYYLMDYDIQLVPQKRYNDKTQKFEDLPRNEFLIPTSEEKLRAEIDSIKKLVPLKDRYKYFR